MAGEIGGGAPPTTPMKYHRCGKSKPLYILICILSSKWLAMVVGGEVGSRISSILEVVLLGWRTGVSGSRDRPLCSATPHLLHPCNITHVAVKVIVHTYMYIDFKKPSHGGMGRGEAAAPWRSSCCAARIQHMRCWSWTSSLRIFKWCQPHGYASWVPTVPHRYTSQASHYSGTYVYIHIWI